MKANHTAGKPLQQTMNNMKAKDYRKTANVANLGTSTFTGNITGGEIVKISAAALEDPNNAELLKALNKDTNRGMSIYFKEGEEIYFFPWEEQMFEVEGWELQDNQVRLLLRCAAYCARYKEFFFPLTIVRTIPVDEDITLPNGDVVNSREYHVKDNAIGEKLLPVMSDLKRVRESLAGKVIKVTEKVLMHQRSRKNPDELIPRSIYKFNEVK